jgi:uncharacterized membrane-anchored protein YitT (DUF2179 family)
MGTTGVTDEDRQILYCVVTRLEIGSVKDAAMNIDPAAFITTQALSDVENGLIRRQFPH